MELWRHLDLGARITTFWLTERAQASRSWSAHRDVDQVMLVTAWAPDEYLAAWEAISLRPPAIGVGSRGLPAHSSRSVSAGSTEAARRAGPSEASAAATRITPTSHPYVAGSWRDTP